MSVLVTVRTAAAPAAVIVSVTRRLARRDRRALREALDTQHMKVNEGGGVDSLADGRSDHGRRGDRA